eukprot:scaffold127261_cov21-Tisochrysis_lutea.AAC.3
MHSLLHRHELAKGLLQAKSFSSLTYTHTHGCVLSPDRHCLKHINIAARSDRLCALRRRHRLNKQHDKLT